MTQTTLSAATPASPEPRRAALRESGFVPSVKNLEARHDAGSVARALLPVRCCSADDEELTHTAASLKIEILIANLELEFQPTHRKLSPLRISNRKYSRVSRSPRARKETRRVPALSCKPFWVASHSPLVTQHSPLTCPEEDHRRRRATAFLIYGSAIKTAANPQGFNNVRFSNRR